MDIDESIPMFLMIRYSGYPCQIMCYVVNKFFLKVISFIKCLFQLLSYNPIKLLLSSNTEWQFSLLLLLAVWYCHLSTMPLFFFDSNTFSTTLSTLIVFLVFITLNLYISDPLVHTIFETSTSYWSDRCLKSEINCFQNQGFSGNVTSHITCYVHHHTCHTSFSGIEKKCAKL